MQPCCAPLVASTQHGDGRVTVDAVYCALCKEQVTVPWKEHATSTLHLFNRQCPMPASPVCLPEDNRGYQMLQQLGWREGSGLGPTGGGPKAPVATLLKQDRLGVGHTTRARARVTHTPAHSESEAALAPDGLSRAQRLAQRPKLAQPTRQPTGALSAKERQRLKQRQRAREQWYRHEVYGPELPEHLEEIVRGRSRR